MVLVRQSCNASVKSRQEHSQKHRNFDKHQLNLNGEAILRLLFLTTDTFDDALLCFRLGSKQSTDAPSFLNANLWFSKYVFICPTLILDAAIGPAVAVADKVPAIEAAENQSDSAQSTSVARASQVRKDHISKFKTKLKPRAKRHASKPALQPISS